MVKNPSSSTSPFPPPPAYPRWLESWWTNRARQTLRARDFAETQSALQTDIQRLSDLFTTARQSDFGDYGRDPRLLLAYGLFYFPQTFTRIQFPLREALLLRNWRPDNSAQPLRLLDLGAGLGGATLGAATLLRQFPFIPAVETLAVDQSTASLAALRELARDNSAHLPGIDLQTAKGDLKTWFRKAPRDDRWDIITASFSLGEGFFDSPDTAVLDWIKTALSRLRPNGLLLIAEPSLRETSERLERLRDLISAENSARIWAPCPHHRDCPLLATGKFWCHEVRNWIVPESLSFLNRHLFRSVRDLKFSFLLLGPPPESGPLPAFPASHMRLVSPMSDMKGRYMWTGCAGDGQRYEYEIQKRDLSREDKTALDQVERGDLADVSASDPLGNPNKRRVKTIADLWISSQGPGPEAACRLSGRP